MIRSCDFLPIKENLGLIRTLLMKISLDHTSKPTSMRKNEHILFLNGNVFHKNLLVDGLDKRSSAKNIYFIIILWKIRVYHLHIYHIYMWYLWTQIITCKWRIRATSSMLDRA